MPLLGTPIMSVLVLFSVKVVSKCFEQATRVITASEDDNSPVIMVWDLRNARAPEKVKPWVLQKLPMEI